MPDHAIAEQTELAITVDSNLNPSHAKPHPLVIVSQSDSLNQIVDINSYTEWQTVQIHNGNKRSHFLFFVLSLVLADRSQNIASVYFDICFIFLCIFSCTLYCFV